MSLAACYCFSTARVPVCSQRLFFFAFSGTYRATVLCMPILQCLEDKEARGSSHIPYPLTNGERQEKATVVHVWMFVSCQRLQGEHLLKPVGPCLHTHPANAKSPFGFEAKQSMFFLLTCLVPQCTDGVWGHPHHYDDLPTSLRKPDGTRGVRHLSWRTTHAGTGRCSQILQSLQSVPPL